MFNLNAFTMDNYESKADELREILLQLKKAYPNGYKQLAWEAQQLFDELIDPDEWVEE